MAKRRNRAIHKPFESRTEYGRFTKIVDDMQASEAWNDLTYRQTGLYLAMKRLYTPKKCTDGIVVPANDQNITFPHSIWGKKYRENYRAWKEDCDALISHGFIEIVEHGKNTRTPDIFKFSAKWQDWLPQK